MNGLKTITFTGDLNNILHDMTVDVAEGATLILKQARFEITHAANIYTPRHINVEIGTTISSDHVIDTDPRANYFKVGLDYNSFNNGGGGGGVNTNISITYPDIGYKVSGRISKNCVIRLYNENFVPLPNLVYYFLQFVVI